jgi:hypothetical protein
MAKISEGIRTHGVDSHRDVNQYNSKAKMNKTCASHQ